MTTSARRSLSARRDARGCQRGHRGAGVDWVRPVGAEEERRIGAIAEVGRDAIALIKNQLIYYLGEIILLGSYQYVVYNNYYVLH